ncbi:MAG: hypothetical protein L3J12_08390 [Spirochaetales bacterium]|nr:hypothetical protein [Spirochaetales bacterium]
MRDKFEAIQYYGATLYEALRTFSKMKKHFQQLPEYEENKSEVAFLDGEIDDKKSFSNTILALIRDKMTFHFDADVFIDSIMLLSDEILTLYESESDKNIDTYFPAVTELYFNYLISYIEEDISDKEKLEKIYSQMTNISNILCKVLEEIIAGIFKKNDIPSLEK